MSVIKNKKDGLFFFIVEVTLFLFGSQLLLSFENDDSQSQTSSTSFEASSRNILLS